jgi:hypothetical protein
VKVELAKMCETTKYEKNASELVFVSSRMKANSNFEFNL